MHAFALILALLVAGCDQQTEGPSRARKPLAEPIEVGQTPPRPFTGRFIQAWTARNVAEITGARRRDGDTIVAEVVLPRAPGQMTEGGVEVAVLSFSLRIACDPVEYEIVRTLALAEDGRVLAGHDSPNGDDGVQWSPEGPYGGLARELCAGAAPQQADFVSLQQYRTEALTRPGMVLRANGPPTVTPAN